MLTAGLLRVDLGLAGVLLQPVAEGGGAGVVDDPDLGADREALGDALAGPLGGQRDQIRVEARLAQHLAGDGHREGQRKHGARVRLDQHRVAGGEGGEEAGIAVPRGERVAADEEGDAATGRDERLVQLQRVALALRLGPVGGVRGTDLLPVGVRDGLQAAVLGVRAARLERHHEGLAARVHHGVGQLVGAGTDPRQDLQTDQGPDLRSRRPPGARAGLHRRKQDVRVGVRILDAELRPVRRDLAAGPAVGAGLPQVEPGVQDGVESGLALGRTETARGTALAVGLRVLRVR